LLKGLGDDRIEAAAELPRFLVARNSDSFADVFNLLSQCVAKRPNYTGGRKCDRAALLEH
jgi:hypothetical protein